MGFFKSIKNSVQDAGKNAGKAVVDAVAAPYNYVVVKPAGKVLEAAAPVLGRATQILQQNKGLTSIAGGLTGLPVGDFFGGGQSGGGGGGYIAQPVGQTVPQQDNTLLYVGIAGAVVVLFLVMRK